MPGKLSLTVLTVLLWQVSACADAAPDLSAISLPPGFTIELFTDEVPNARSMTLGANGTVFVATRRDGRVYGVVTDGASVSRVVTIASGLQVPNGIAYHDGDLYVAELTRVIRFRDIESRLDKPPAAEVIGDPLPAETHHGWRYLDFGPDGKMYITIGAPCNVCDRSGFGIIVRQNRDGTGRETVAYGVRNSVGLAWHPETGELWFTDNGRDMLGDDSPPGELNRVLENGQHFGFPYCHAGEISDPDFGVGKKCEDYVAPALKLGPHVAPLGLAFYDGEMFPRSFRGQLFIAEHGSWNRSKKIGYRVMMVGMENGQPVSYTPFAEGWLQNEVASGRPVDVLVQADGSLLISDDQEGRLYRIAYVGPPGVGN